MQRFELRTFWFFSYRLSKLAFLARILSRAFEKRAPGHHISYYKRSNNFKSYTGSVKLAMQYRVLRFDVTEVMS